MKFIKVCFWYMMLVVFASVALANGKTKNDLSTLNKNVKKINSGFVFIGGKYISLPYTVTVQKGWLNINVIPVKEISEWPFTEESSDKPVIPPNVLKKAKSYNDVGKWSGKMYRWIMRNKKGTKAQQQALKEFQESLPFVKEVTFPSAGEMNVLLKNGELVEWGLEEVDPIVTIKEQAENLEYQRKSMEKCLADNDVFFFFPENSGELTFGDSTVAEKFQLLLKTLASDRPEKEKLNILFRMMIIPENESKNGLILIRNFKPSKELNVRVAKVIEQYKKEDNDFDHPYTLKDIPKELPSVILERQHRIEEQEDAKLKKKGTMNAPLK